MKESITEDVKEVIRNPNEERSLETSNHISELMVYAFSKLDAIEAVCYWRNKYDELLNKTQDEFRDEKIRTILNNAFCIAKENK